MVLNVHPIFVHIPIAFLTFYALAELVQWKRLTRQQFWPILKFAFLGIGVLGAFAALQTGELAGEIYRGTDMQALIELHALFATITTWYFVALAVLYLTHFLKGKFAQRHLASTLTLLDRLHCALFGGWLSVPFGIIGLALITITGALGGAIVYGPDIDPVVSFVYSLFF